MKAEGGKPWDIRERVFEYALQSIKLYQKLQDGKDGAGWVIGKQYLRSATSVGASIEEAQSAESRVDFVHKYGIAQKEVRESLYWLKLLKASSLLSGDKIQSLIQETEELTAIITTIIKKTKQSSK